MFLQNFWNFGLQLVDTNSVPQTITITNNGSASLEIDEVVFGEDDDNAYSLIDNCSNTSVGIGKSCTITVTFSPNELGELNATIVITDDAAESTQTITLLGIGAELEVIGTCQLRQHAKISHLSHWSLFAYFFAGLFFIGLIRRIKAKNKM